MSRDRYDVYNTGRRHDARGLVTRPDPDRDVFLDGRTSEVACGRCGRTVPSGRAVLVVHWRALGQHQLFCPEHAPAGTRPWRGDLTRGSPPAGTEGPLVDSQGG